MSQKYFLITNLIFVRNSFILLYQDNYNNWKLGPTYDITNDRRKALVEFKVFCKYLYFPFSIFLLDSHHPNHYHFWSVFNQKSLITLVYIKFDKLILTFLISSFSLKYFSPPFCPLWIVFFLLLLSVPSFFLFFFTTYCQYCFFW